MVKHRNRDVKTKRHLKNEKKKTDKEEQKRELLTVKKTLTTDEKANLNPFHPIAPTRCNRCGDGFGDVSGAKSHKASKHGDCKSFCPRSTGKKPTCGCVFPLAKHLRFHMEYHKGIMAAAVEEEDSSSEEELVFE